MIYSGKHIRVELHNGKIETFLGSYWYLMVDRQHTKVYHLNGDLAMLFNNEDVKKVSEDQYSAMEL